MPFKEITYNSDLLKKTWVLKETITPATHNELSRVVMDLVSNNDFIPSLTNLRKNSTAYVVGDCKNSSTLPSWAYLECTVAGTTASAEPAWGTVTAGLEKVDGTVTWRIRDIKSASGEQIGSIKAFLVTKAQPGWLALDTGALVSRTTYAELWAWVQENAPLISEADWQTQAASQTSVGEYSTGDGSTTFRLPKMIDYVRGGTQDEVGEWQSDDLKSHKHIVSDGLRCLGGNTSAPYGSQGQNNKSSQANTSDFGGEETRPKTVRFLYCVKAFDAETNQGLIDITALANDVTNKVNISDYINDFVHNFDENGNGYQKLKGGLILQVGSVSIDSGTSGTGTITFPVAFTERCLLFIPVDNVGAASIAAIGWDVAHSTNSLAKYWWNGTNLGYFNYLAIGY
ncbi:phage tail protein [Anaerosinus massiliensis]|uniref:phage tail protein n=1 Tax=Massilibacillus massiliensis TaxID=1806837 RepID=UPI000ABE362C|nr:phage tail protein [Massilibacillus massiliensis]